VVALLEAGADCNTWSTGPHNYGKSAIFYAITMHRDDVARLLLAHGARARIVNNKGQSVSSLALTHLTPETQALIRQAEATEQQEWLNFRRTHSDGQQYGDLDPRFLPDAGAHAGTGAGGAAGAAGAVATADGAGAAGAPLEFTHSVNPTTTESRKQRRLELIEKKEACLGYCPPGQGKGRGRKGGAAAAAEAAAAAAEAEAAPCTCDGDARCLAELRASLPGVHLVHELLGHQPCGCAGMAAHCAREFGPNKHQWWYHRLCGAAAQGVREHVCDEGSALVALAAVDADFDTTGLPAPPKATSWWRRKRNAKHQGKRTAELSRKVLRFALAEGAALSEHVTKTAAELFELCKHDTFLFACQHVESARATDITPAQLLRAVEWRVHLDQRGNAEQLVRLLERFPAAARAADPAGMLARLLAEKAYDRVSLETCAGWCVRACERVCVCATGWCWCHVLVSCAGVVCWCRVRAAVTFHRRTEAPDCTLHASLLLLHPGSCHAASRSGGRGWWKR
jgi:hypothetical protein